MLNSSSSDSEEFYDANNEFNQQINEISGNIQPYVISSTSYFKESDTSSTTPPAAAAFNAPISAANLDSPQPVAQKTLKEHFISRIGGLRNMNTMDDSPFSRHKKLDYLRHKMRDEFDAAADENAASGLPGTENDLRTGQHDFGESVSEVSSLASWSKNLLSDDVFCKTEGVVTAMDTVSTKAIFPDSTNAGTLKLTKASAAPLMDSLQQQQQQASNSVPPNQPTSNNPSTESSKSSTLERYVTPESKTSSLDRRTHTSRSLSNKSSSLTRDYSGLSACEQYLYDNAQLAALERKNSAAAEVIEALTSQIVKNVKLECESVQKSSSTSKSEPVCSKNERVALKTDLDEASTSKGEPDIVSSNRIKDETQTVAENCNASDSSVVDHQQVVPFKPPRRKKQRLNNSAPSSVPPSPLAIYSLSPKSLIANVDKVDSPTSDNQNDSLILQSTLIKNLDTGEQFPLGQADEKLPKCDPLTLHIMRLTNDYNRQSHSQDSIASDSESFRSADDLCSVSSYGTKRNYLSHAKLKTLHYKKLFGKSFGHAVNKAVRRMRNVAEGVRYHFHTDEGAQSEEDETSDNSKMIRIRAAHKHKGPYHFEQVRLTQHLSGEHEGSVWCLKFSHCGRLLATGGQDNLIRVWVLKDAFSYFNDMRSRYSADDLSPFHEQLQKCAQAGVVQSAESCQSSLSSSEAQQNFEVASNTSSFGQDDAWAPFVAKPFLVYRGHSADVLDLSWSKNYFVLSSSMDKTVRLWHTSRAECLCCFQHIDFVTAIAFLPRDDRYFLSGSLDGKLRLWHIPEKKVALWNEVDGGKLVTTLTFARNGKFAVVGTYDGRCIFYSTDQLKYHTQIDVKSSHGKNSRPHKVTGLESFQDKLLVTSNDSRIRLYDLRDLSLTCKYKGYTNYSSQIRASFSHNGKYIVCGSEDKQIYLWKTTMDSDTLSLSVRKDRNRLWESIRAHNGVVTAAVFAPKPELIFQQIYATKRRATTCESVAAADDSKFSDIPANKQTPSSSNVVEQSLAGEILVSADFSGAIYVFINRPKIKTVFGLEAK